MIPCSIRSSLSADQSVRFFPPSHSAVSLTLLTGAGAWRASARAHSRSRQLGCWTDGERRRNGDLQLAFSENIHLSGLRRIASTVGTATYGLRQALRPESISRWP